MFVEAQGINIASNKHTMASKSCCHSKRGKLSMFRLKSKAIYSDSKLYDFFF
uniref:Uncharacterized protein n=1 Tax=Arundo donax TaxID=35708 RepID=A0A0A9GU59_ARUDO